MVIDANEIYVRNVIYSDRSRIANLMHFGTHVHQHLDWKSPLDWIGRQPYLVIEKNGEVIATLACPPEIPDITWLRLFAVSTNIQTDTAWRLLWDSACSLLSEKGNIRIAALSLQNWFSDLLEASEYRLVDNVIVLVYSKNAHIPKPKLSSIQIRQMMPEDIPFVLEIDNSAFNLEWRNSLQELELAFNMSAYTTIAESDDEIVGYQYSTSSGMGGHLARLAVKDIMQGQGIGYSLVNDMLAHFRKQGITNISVNTQRSNEASLGLYAKAGFNFTGETYRVYQYTL